MQHLTKHLVNNIKIKAIISETIENNRKKYATIESSTCDQNVDGWLCDKCLVTIT